MNIYSHFVSTYSNKAKTCSNHTYLNGSTVADFVSTPIRKSSSTLAFCFTIGCLLGGESGLTDSFRDDWALVGL